MNIHNERVDELNNRLKQALKIRGWKASDLSERTHIPKSAISYYLSGKSHPRQDRLHIISVSLDVSEAWLLGYDVARERENNNDIIMNIVAHLQKDNDLLHTVSDLIQLSNEKYTITKQLISTMKTDKRD